MTELRIKKIGERNSSIELLKLISIFVIIVSHCLKTLYSEGEYVDFFEYQIDLNRVTTNIQQFIMSFLTLGGMFGNSAFFICSAWFLLDSSSAKIKKVIQFVLDVWLVSIIFLICIYFLRDGDIDRKLMVCQLFPTTFGTTWFITCYILFYPIHPILNKIIYGMGQKRLLRSVIILFFCYLLVNTFIKSAFFPSKLILWVAFYFTIGYIKLYLGKTSLNKRINYMLAFGCLAIQFLVMIAIDLLGLYFGVMDKDLLFFRRDCIFLVFISAIGFFNLFRNRQFSNSCINKLAACSLFVYLIHENSLLKHYYRPQWWNYIYNNFGYDHILLWVFLMASILFITSMALSFIYKGSFQRVTILVNEWIYQRTARYYNIIETRILSLE